MLETESVGENICGLCAAMEVSPGDKSEAAGEYAEPRAGEPRSEIVRQPTADGVAARHQ